VAEAPPSHLPARSVPTIVYTCSNPPWRRRSKCRCWPGPARPPLVCAIRNGSDRLSCIKIITIELPRSVKLVSYYSKLNCLLGVQAALSAPTLFSAGCLLCFETDVFFLRIIPAATMNTVTAQAAGSADPPCCPFVPLCFECGTRRNPCHCRILGPTLGFVAFAVAACVEWPVGAFVYCFRHLKGRRIMAHPAAVVYPRVASCLPI
jgi:hypothetical protein